MMSHPPRPARPSAPLSLRMELVYASTALFFSLMSWVINPYFITCLVAIGFAVRVLLRIRRAVGRQRTVAFWLSVAALVIGVLALIGTILLFTYPVA
ncbi:MAG: hypothetical protein ABI310_08235 [Microbacteriaceae bacterium]